MMFSGELELARKRALRLLSYRPRTEAEIVHRLMKYGFSTDVVNVLISQFKDLHLIDDRSFASEWIQYRLKEKKKGKHYIYLELIQKGVPREIASQAVEFISEEEEYEIALSQARKKIARGYSWPAVGRYLAGQGFPSRVIYKIHRSMTTGPGDD